jgi:hypothetical protein
LSGGIRRFGRAFPQPVGHPEIRATQTDRSGQAIAKRFARSLGKTGSLAQTKTFRIARRLFLSLSFPEVFS